MDRWRITTAYGALRFTLKRRYSLDAKWVDFKLYVLLYAVDYLTLRIGSIQSWGRVRE